MIFNESYHNMSSYATTLLISIAFNSPWALISIITLFRLCSYTNVTLWSYVTTLERLLIKTQNIRPLRCVWAFQPTDIVMPDIIYSNNNGYCFIYPVLYLLFNNAFALPEVTKAANLSHKRLVHLFLFGLSLSALLS